MGLFHHSTILQLVSISGTNGQELFRFNLNNIYKANSYSTVAGMITTRYVSCCQEIIMSALKETSVSNLYANRFLMPDRRANNGLKPL